MMKKKFLSALLALCMLMTLAPVTVFAAAPTVSTEQELRDAIASAQDGDTIKLTQDITITPKGSTLFSSLTAHLTIWNDIILDLNGKTLRFDTSNLENTNYKNAFALLSVNGANVTITGNGTIDAEMENYTAYGANVINNGNLTIESGTFTGAPTAVQVTKGTLTVKGGTFKQADTLATDQGQSSKNLKYLVNAIDDAYEDGTARIYLLGGTYGYNYSYVTEKVGPAYVPVDYTVTEDTEKNTWTVTPKGEMTVNKPNNITNSTVNATVSGVTVPTSSSEGSDITAEEKTLTIDAQVSSASGVTTTNVTVGGAALDAIKKAENVADVKITTDVGTLTVSESALDKIAENAKAGDTTSDITLSIEKKDTTSATTYTLTAVSSAGKEVFSSENAGADATITVSVPYDKGTAYVYYMGENGPEKLTATLDTESKTLTWDVQHFSDYVVTQTESGIFVNSNDGVVVAESLDALLTSLSNKTGSYEVFLAPDGENVLSAAQYSITADITLKGGIVNATVPAGNSGLKMGFTIKGGGALTLDGTTMTINGSAQEDTSASSGDYDGVAFQMDKTSALTVQNGAKLTLQNLNRGFYVTDITGVTINVIGAGTEFIAKNMDGNFSQGGAWNIKDGALLDISNIGANGLSATSVYVSGSTVNVSNTAMRGISINENGGFLDIRVNSTVNVTNCGSDTVPAVNLVNDTNNNKYAALKVYVNSVLNVTATEEGKNTNISLSTNDSISNTLSGTIVGDILNLGNKVAINDNNGKMYESLDAAVQEATSGQTVRILTTTKQELSKAVKGKLVIADGQTVNITDPTVVATSAGNIHVFAGASLQVSGNTLIGEGSNIELTDGYINLNKTGMLGTNLSLNLKFFGAKAEVPAEKYWTTTMSFKNSSGGDNISVPMNVNLDASSELAVSGQLRIANDSTLTLAEGSKLTVNNDGLLRIGSDGKIEGNGTITNSGTVTLHKGTNTNASVNPTIILTSTGAVYSEFDAASMIGPSGNVSTTTGGFTVDGVTSGTPAQLVTFTHKYTYYTPSGGGGGGGGVTTYSVTLPTDVANGKLSVSPKNAAKNTTVTLTVTPDEGYELATLTVTDKNGKTVELTKKSDTQYTFKMPASNVSIKATFAPVETPPATLPFTDVDGHWALDAITYVYEKGMMNGTSPTTFSPESQLTRGMIVTILYRLEDEPAVSDSTFSDVDGDMYYADPIAWAADNGIVTGFPDGTFGPETSITREQLATILYRYADYLDCDMTPAADLSGYTDAGTISSYAQQAMAWANAEGLITGVTETTLKPTGTATRAQVATILMRFCENVIK